MGCCCCNESLGRRQITRYEFLNSFLVSILALLAAVVTAWRIYMEHNYLVDDIYFYLTLIPSGLEVIVSLVIFIGFLTPERLNRCIGSCCCYANNFYGFFAWCDPLLCFVLQVLVWVPFVCISRVQVAHYKIANNISLSQQQYLHDERSELFDIGEWPWTPQDYNLDILFVQACFLVIVIIRLFSPRGGITFSEMLKFAIVWLTEALDLLAFLDDLNAEVLPHPYLAYAVAVAASVSSLQFLSTCTFIFYPVVFAEEKTEEEEKGVRYRLGLSITSAFFDDIPLLVIRCLLFKEIYLPLKQLSAVYLFFMCKSFLFACMGLTLACIEGYKCTKDGHDNAVSPVDSDSIKMSEEGFMPGEDEDYSGEMKGSATYF
ncbi:uncharacterized protein [Ptychodera flava]|uniref:uncharacterized protein n=1 Tax=Ptychodera flava TaxID=63121 RepID=UPI00396A9F3A